MGRESESRTRMRNRNPRIISAALTLCVHRDTRMLVDHLRRMGNDQRAGSSWFLVLRGRPGIIGVENYASTTGYRPRHPSVSTGTEDENILQWGVSALPRNRSRKKHPPPNPQPVSVTVRHKKTADPCWERRRRSCDEGFYFSLYYLLL